MDFRCEEHSIQLNSNLRPQYSITLELQPDEVGDMLASLRCPAGNEACEASWWIIDGEEKISMVELQTGENNSFERFGKLVGVEVE